MKQTHYTILFFLGIALATASCNKTKTYADHLKDEKKAIDKFISQHNLKILDKLPADTIFKANEFYRDPATGVYFNIVERGDFDPQIRYGKEIYVRFWGLRYFANDKDTVKYGNMESNEPAIIIYRGPVTMANLSSLYPNTVPAWVVPLSCVGHTGKVKLIVPFNAGLPSDRSGYASGSKTTYYDNVQYRFEPQRNPK